MSISDIERRLDGVQEQIEALTLKEPSEAEMELLHQLRGEEKALYRVAKQSLTAADRVTIARHSGRPNTKDYIDALFQDFIPLAGDRLYGEDESILGGIASFHGIPVTVIGHRKGKTLDENVNFRFGMPNPEGYRKAQRLMLQANKFGRPIVTFIDTPGAYPGMDAEARGQGEAIASSLALMSDLSVPVIAVVIGEGGSGGALALAVADKIFMLENAVFSVLSPEGFASILWKDSSRWKEAAEVMKLTAKDLKHFEVVDEIIGEPPCGAHRKPSQVFGTLDEVLLRELTLLMSQSGATLQKNRYAKFRALGAQERV